MLDTAGSTEAPGSKDDDNDELAERAARLFARPARVFPCLPCKGRGWIILVENGRSIERRRCIVCRGSRHGR